MEPSVTDNICVVVYFIYRTLLIQHVCTWLGSLFSAGWGYSSLY